MLEERSHYAKSLGFTGQPHFLLLSASSLEMQRDQVASAPVVMPSLPGAMSPPPQWNDALRL